MTDAVVPAAEGTSKKSERTVAIFADPRASAMLMWKTMEALIDSSKIERALIDPSTEAGLAAALAFEQDGIKINLLDFGQQDHFIASGEERTLFHPVIDEDKDRLRNHTAGHDHHVEVAELGMINANVVLIPAMAGDVLDFTPGTVVGAVLQQLQEARREVMVIDAPERGLQRKGDGEYIRRIIHVAAPSPED